MRGASGGKRNELERNVPPNEPGLALLDDQRSSYDSLEHRGPIRCILYHHNTHCTFANRIVSEPVLAAISNQPRETVMHDPPAQAVPLDRQHLRGTGLVAIGCAERRFDEPLFGGLKGGQ